jgi:ABC-2 type transport system permease protein
MPSLAPTVTADVETLHSAESTATLPAPFVMTFTSWLAAMVGTILLFLATSQMASMNRAYVRTLVPVMTMGLASFVLALVVIFTTSQWEQFIGVWLSVWIVSLCLVWLFMGIFEVAGLWSLLVILPTVFYQPVLGGSMAPVAAAPDWLREIGEVIPFDSIGAAYRSVMYDASGGLPFIWLLSAALIGIILIWGSAIVKGK